MFPPAGGGGDFAIHILKLSCLTSSLDTSGDLGGVTPPTQVRASSAGKTAVTSECAVRTGALLTHDRVVGGWRRARRRQTRPLASPRRWAQRRDISQRPRPS